MYLFIFYYQPNIKISYYSHKFYAFDREVKKQEKVPKVIEKHTRTLDDRQPINSLIE